MAEGATIGLEKKILEKEMSQDIIVVLVNLVVSPFVFYSVQLYSITY